MLSLEFLCALKATELWHYSDLGQSCALCSGQESKCVYWNRPLVLNEVMYSKLT